MVSQREILQLSKQFGVPPSSIDKDWVLGHLLNSLFSFNDFSKNFVFKGGTCLRKCYFENYRFSEDLDFTLIDKHFVINQNVLKKYLSTTASNSGIKFGSAITIKNQIHNNTPQGYEITIPFWGADHKPNQKPIPESRWQTKIKIDISFSEKIWLPPEKRSIFHPYTDSYIINNKVVNYTINEIIAEKLRALVQRNRPRDIYDLFFLSDEIETSQYNNIHTLLIQKAMDKNIEFLEFDSFINPVKAIKNRRAWANSLSHHMASGELIDFDIAYTKVQNFVREILKN